MIVIPEFKKLSFYLDRSRGKYLVHIFPLGFTKVPAELIVEERQKDVIRHDTELILRGSNTHNQEQKRQLNFFTGLRKTQYADVYDGCILTFGRDSKRVKNYVLLRFTHGTERFTLLYISGFRPYPDKRTEFITGVIGQGLI